MKLIDIKVLDTAIERKVGEILGGQGVTYAQISVLGYLKSNTYKAITRKDIMRNTGISEENVLNIIETLAAEDMVTLSENAGTPSLPLVHITEKAEAVLLQTWRQISYIQQQVCDNISAKDLALFDAVLSQMILNAARLAG